MDYAAWNILPCHRRWVVKGSVRFIPVLKDGAFSLILRDVGDVLRLLSVTRKLTTDGYRVATVAMGGPGRHSRVILPFYGSRIGYAPVRKGAATAPGQIDLETLREVYETIK
jgi:3-dehydroquinate dehydratase-1